MPKKGRPPVRRAENPYVINKSQFDPGASLADFVGLTALDHLPAAPASRSNHDLPWWTWGIIYHFNVPVLRRVLESILVFDHGFDPVSVTDVLRSLRTVAYIEGTRIVCTLVKFDGDTEPNHLYSCDRDPTEEEIEYLRGAHEKRSRAMSREVLGEAGERYFRAILRASGCYSSITQVVSLGSVQDDNGKNKLDLKATSNATGVRFGISIKNQREWLRPDDKALKDVVKKAYAHSVKPWLVVPYATKEAIVRCQGSGIRLSELRRQIVPAEDQEKRSMRKVIDDLRPVIGVMPFEYLHTRPGRTLEKSVTAESDIAALRQLD
jgi:hypothetical protein